MAKKYRVELELEVSNIKLSDLFNWVKSLPTGITTDAYTSATIQKIEATKMEVLD